MTPLVILSGPTGAGKSAAALRVAEAHQAEIVNLDAFQIYRGMEIGTAQPSLAEQARVPHWLYGFYDPKEAMSAATYAKLADQAIKEITSRGKRVLLVGGAGFYMRALLEGFFEAPPPDLVLRERFKARALEEGGKEALHQELEKVDPETAARLPTGDAYRVSRALEVFYQTGKPLSWHHKTHVSERRYRSSLLLLEPLKEELLQRQEARLKAMFAAGWEQEVRALLSTGLSKESPSFRAIGYRAVAERLEGKRTKEEVLLSVQREHKLYAKRQRTWMRAEEVTARYLSSEDRDLDREALRRWEGC